MSLITVNLQIMNIHFSKPTKKRGTKQHRLIVKQLPAQTVILIRRKVNIPVRKHNKSFDIYVKTGDEIPTFFPKLYRKSLYHTFLTMVLRS